MTVVYRASELGGCIRELVAGRLKFEPEPFPKDLEVVMEEGARHEQWVIEGLIEGGEQVSDLQEEVELWVSHGILVQGHMDGRIYDPILGNPRVLEIKTMSDSVFKDWERLGWNAPGAVQKYKWQLSCYMNATGLEALVVIKNRNSGRILRAGVELPWYSTDEIRQRVLDAEDWVSRNALPDCEKNQWPCRYWYLNVGTEEQEDEKKEDVDYDRILAAASNLQEIKVQAAELKDREVQARKDVIELLGNRGRYKEQGLSITLYDYTQTSINRKRLADDGVDVDKYLDKTTHNRLRVKLPKDEEEE